MKTKTRFFFLPGIIALLITAAATCVAQKPAALYQQMTPAQRAAFVSQQARALAREISGNDYQFTPAFETAIQRSVDYYVRPHAWRRSLQNGCANHL
jgi:hypothetical protein